MRDRAELFKKTSGPPVTRRRSEAVTLAVAVTFAVGLGIAAGFWINARLAPTSTNGAPRPARSSPEARVSAPPAPVAQPSPCDGCATSSVAEATPVPVPLDKAGEARRGADSKGATVVARAAEPVVGPEPSRAGEVAAGSAEAHGATGSEAVAAASPDPSRPVAWQVGSSPKAGTRAGARVNVEHDAAQSGPCALYTSANSLGVRVGGAAPLILGGPGVGVRINVSTPDRSALEVIYEGPAGGDKGWLKYSVRSIGDRPGLYKVRVSTPCGSQTISVTVK